MRAGSPLCSIFTGRCGAQGYFFFFFTKKNTSQFSVAFIFLFASFDLVAFFFCWHSGLNYGVYLTHHSSPMHNSTLLSKDRDMRIDLIRDGRRCRPSKEVKVLHKVLD